MFKAGDRVMYTGRTYREIKNGERGTVIGHSVWDEVEIQWDEYNPGRHDASHNMPMGHGWYVSDNELVILGCEVDFGEFSTPDCLDTKFLFGM